MAEAQIGRDWNEMESGNGCVADSQCGNDSLISKFKLCFGWCFRPDEEVPPVLVMEENVEGPSTTGGAKEPDLRKLVLTNSIGSRSIKSQKSTKSLSAFSIGSIISLKNDSSSLMSLKYVDLYHKMIDTVSDRFSKSQHGEEMSVFPNQGLAVLVGKTPFHKESEENRQLNLWSHNIGKISFSVVDHHSI